MFLKIFRLMYFDTLNLNMTIAERYKKPFSSYNFFDIQTIRKISRTPEMFLQITRMMYFDTLNSKMTIAKRYKKPFSSYKNV